MKDVSVTVSTYSLSFIRLISYMMSIFSTVSGVVAVFGRPSSGRLRDIPTAFKFSSSLLTVNSDEVGSRKIS